MPRADPDMGDEVSTSPVRYWETHRLPYNLVLLVVFLFAMLPRWWAIHTFLGCKQLIELVVLATLANVCYSAAYLADVLARRTGIQARWPSWRGLLWFLGTAFAAILTLYWTLDEILPDLGR